MDRDWLDKLDDLAERIAAKLANKPFGYSVELTYGNYAHRIQADKVSTDEHYTITVGLT